MGSLERLESALDALEERVETMIDRSYRAIAEVNHEELVVESVSSVTCDYCKRPAVLVDGSIIYPHRPDLFAKRFWHCAGCDAYVGCHKPKSEGGMGDGTVPLGRLANVELRALKQRAHALFDPLWKSREMSRQAAYHWLGRQMNLAPSETHIGMFNEEQCRTVIELIKLHQPKGK